MFIRVLTNAGATKTYISLSGNLSIVPQGNGGAQTRFKFGNQNTDINYPFATFDERFKKWLDPKTADPQNFNRKYFEVQETS